MLDWTCPKYSLYLGFEPQSPTGNLVAVLRSRINRLALFVLLTSCGPSSVSQGDLVRDLAPPPTTTGELSWETVADGTFRDVGLMFDESVLVVDDTGLSLCTTSCTPIVSGSFDRIVTRSDRGAWLLNESVVLFISNTATPLAPAPADLVDVGLGSFAGLWWLGADGLAEGRPGLQRVRDSQAVDR
ncbi:MAG: hypothetical protein AAF658_07540, partial [Myxococcota bacterium]